MAKALFYSPYFAPIQVPDNYEERTWESCNLTKKGFIINWQATARPSIEFVDGQQSRIILEANAYHLKQPCWILLLHHQNHKHNEQGVTHMVEAVAEEG
ncbi:hypothetical protein JHK82_018851 [Glycine max]|nr:hypothetical protein JHK82_018851 [Glycine max]